MVVLCICCLLAQLAAQTHKESDYACKAELAARQSAHVDAKAAAGDKTSSSSDQGVGVQMSVHAGC